MWSLPSECSRRIVSMLCVRVSRSAASLIPLSSSATFGSPPLSIAADTSFISESKSFARSTRLTGNTSAEFRSSPTSIVTSCCANISPVLNRSCNASPR